MKNTPEIKLRWILEFFQNAFTELGEFSDKKNIILKRALTHYLLHERQRLYHCATEIQLTEKTVKLILVHASVDSLNSLNSANSAPFRKNPNVVLLFILIPSNAANSLTISDVISEDTFFYYRLFKMFSSQLANGNLGYLYN